MWLHATEIFSLFWSSVFLMTWYHFEQIESHQTNRKPFFHTIYVIDGCQTGDKSLPQSVVIKFPAAYICYTKSQRVKIITCLLIYIWYNFHKSNNVLIIMNLSSKANVLFVQMTDQWFLHPEHHPDSKVHGANMRPTWVLSAPDGPHVGPRNLAIGAVMQICFSWEFIVLT